MIHDTLEERLFFHLRDLEILLLFYFNLFLSFLFLKCFRRIRSPRSPSQRNFTNRSIGGSVGRALAEERRALRYLSDSRNSGLFQFDSDMKILLQ